MIFVFDDCELDTELYEIRRQGSANRIARQTFDLLLLLVQNSDRVVSKDEIIEQIWDGRIITDATISTCVKQARLSVGDDGKAQRIIRTVHGRGFQFVGKLVSRTPSKPHAQPEGPSSGGRDKPSIAVLPLENFGSNSEDQYFADGLTEEIIAYLSRFKELFVYSRSTTAKLSADGVDIRQLHKELGVDFVVEGSIRKSHAAVRVTVQVIDASTDGHVLAEQFERASTPEGIFEIQDEIALLVAGRVASRHGPLGRHTARSESAGLSQNWETYNWITRFYRYYTTYDPELHLSLRDGLELALASDPLSSDGWAALAYVVLDEYRFHINERQDFPALDAALENALRAVRCDPENSFAQLVLAMVYFHRHEIAEFKTVAHRAIELNPGHADVLADVGHCHAFLGEWDRALELMDQAMALSPVHPGWYHYARCWHTYFDGDTAGALTEVKKVPMPGFFWYHAHLAWFCAELDDEDTARREADMMRTLYPQFEQYARYEAHIWCMNEALMESAIAGWRKAGLSIT